MHTEKNVNLVYMFRGHILKFKLKKIIKLKKGQKQKNFAVISKLLSDGDIPVKKVDVVKSSIFKRDTSLLAKLIELVNY